ncbi:MAG: gamma-aminobutyraldehyde dehydrogenase, partial [Gammaproteobacteria bacterium]|nr:gamma-aminobutyraldehyde dehydrogenase [Gammaproteobacteria bacterium]
MATNAQQRMQQLAGTQYIGGEYRPGSGLRREIVDPATGAAFAHYTEATADETEAAVAAAARAQ